MKWLKRKVIKWVREDWNNVTQPDYDGSSKSVGISSSSGSRTPNADPVVNFRIYAAQNGQVLEFTRYDSRIDRNETSVYIIDKEKDLGEFVAKCLSLELLK